VLDKVAAAKAAMNELVQVPEISGGGFGASSTSGTSSPAGGGGIHLTVPVTTQETDPVVWGRAVGRELGDQLSMMGIGVPT
jgi:hypothetical protein